MFRASSCPSSGAYQLPQQPLVYGWNVVVTVLLVVVRPTDWPRPTALLPPRSYGKREAAAAVDKLLMMGMRMPETCWAVFKRQAINLRNCCFLLVDSFENIKKVNKMSVYLFTISDALQLLDFRLLLINHLSVLCAIAVWTGLFLR